MSKPPKQPPAPSHAPAAGTSHEADDDVLHVPRGVSRGTFLFLIGLLIFLMVIWLVPGAMLSMSGSGQNPVAARVRLPSGGTAEWKASDLVFQQRALADAMKLDGYVAALLEVDPFNPMPEDTLRVLVLDRMAEDAGVVITDDELREHLDGILKQRGATAEDFQLEVRQFGYEQRRMEETLRACLRVSRFLQLIGFAGAVPDPKEIEKFWRRDNVEFAFDYVALATESLRAEALKELPDDAALEAWFAKLPEGAKEDLKTGEKRKAEVALFRDAETTPAAELLAAYPEVVPEGAQPTTPEELATRYYNRVSYVRFQKPAVEGADPASAGTFSQEEVQAQCLAEAPIYFAMQRWIDALGARKTAGETIDLVSDSEGLGLDHQAWLEAQDRDAYAGDTALGHADLANAVFDTPADGSFYASPVSLPHGLAVVRVNEREEPTLPAFAELRDRVVERWLEPKMQELAEKRLATLRESFERFEPAAPDEDAPRVASFKEHRRATAEAFAAAAEASGLALKRRDFLNKSGPSSKDPLTEDEEHRTLFTQAWTFGLYDLEADEVAEAGLSYDKKKAYLVRLAGKRDVPLENMSPVQYERYKQSSRASGVREIGKRFDLAYLKQHHGLWLLEDEAAGAAPGS
jgi:hypothetical protein